METKKKPGPFSFYLNLAKLAWLELKTMTPEKLSTSYKLVLGYLAKKRRQRKTALE